MDLPHQPHRHASKRQRLDEAQFSWARASGEKSEEHHHQPSWPSLYQASSGPSLTPSAMQQDFPAPEFRSHLAPPHQNTFSSGFNNISAGPDFSGQLTSQAARFYETHGRPGVGIEETQPAASRYQTGPFSHLMPTYSWPLNVPTPPSDSWTHHAVYPQPFQAQLPIPTSNLIPCHPPPLASFQSSGSSLKSSERASVKTLPPFVPEYDAEIHISDDSAVSLSAQLDKDPSEIVCFGMITAIAAKCERQNSSPFPVQIDSPDRFSVRGRPEIQGRILSEHGQMIQGLLSEQGLDLYVSCTLEDESTTRKSCRSSTQLPCVLDITVYGPLDLFEEIGSWFQEYEIYLQDPRVSHLDVRYSNPQRLSSNDLDSCPLVSEVVSQTSRLAHLQDVTERPDLLDILSTHFELEEALQPAVIRTVLKRHQRQALTFMQQREQGWAFGDKRPDIWESVDTDQGQVFINRISDSHQSEEPPQFYGGIIADPMGLGKTLTMIALAATDLDSDKDSWVHKYMDEDDKPHVSATLVIIPPPLLGTWEEQLSEHVTEGGLECRRHHGKSRLADTNELDCVNIVLTTYHTVSAEWKAGNGVGSSLLFSVRWRRIILDEAHFIRNGNSRMAHAICALDSVSRWAVTGTPIQNRLGDLATLLKFIRIYPYNDPKRFDADISGLWKAGEDKEAVKRLKHLSACLLLRRAKGTINLPPRRDTQCPVDFTREERAVYDNIRQQAITRIDEALHKDLEASRTSIYVNVLQQIESLRLFCNLGLYYHTRHDNFSQSHSEKEYWAGVAQQTFNFQREIGPMICLQCSSVLEMTETVFDDSANTRPNPLFSRCLKFVCRNCTHKLGRTGSIAACGHRPPCPISPVSISSSVLEEISDLMSPQTKTPSFDLPSKVKALISDLKSLPPDVKCVVFSTWRLTLDIVESGLDRASIRSIRFDGKVPQKKRQSVVEKFKTDPNIPVMLLTLSCGAVGLTLTVASRAYLMEPHWNPTLEEQALARIHRIGQTREVTTVRFYVRDSFEERVMEVQESKKHLASMLLSPHDGEQTDDSLGGLHRLRLLLS